jgi:drug/metabolite transporter (DMT)-like permease
VSWQKIVAALFRATPLHLLVYAVAFSLVGICTGLAMQGGSTPLTTVTVRTLGTIAIFVLYFRAAGVRLAMPRREVLIALAIGIPLCVNNWFINLAIAHIPVPLAVLIFYLWPALTTLASWLLGKERFRWPSLFGLVLAFIGLALTLNVDFTATQAKGVWLAVASAFLWSLSFLLLGHFFRGKDTRPATLHMTGLAGVVFLIATLVTGDFVAPVVPSGWVGLAGVAFFYAFAVIGLFSATSKLGPVRVGFFMNFEPISSVMLSALILGQTLQPIQLAGAALVIMALFLFRPPPAVALAVKP